jgi:cell division protein FtsQ
VSAAAGILRRPALLAGLPAAWRRRLVVAVAVVTALGAIYLLWVRDSPFVQVEEVAISGLTSDDAAKIRTALEAEATEMTTLHVRRDRLDRVIEGYPVVRALEVGTDFPHGLSIHVIEHHPAALVVSGHSRVPVAADGSVLRGLPVKPGALPLVKTSGALPGDQVRQEDLLDLLRVAGGAPGPLLSRIDQVERDRERGIVLTLEDGPELVFGDPSGVGDKWRAATSVLANEASQGASYVDVRLPERPAAGGLSVETIEPTDPALTYSQP